MTGFNASDPCPRCGYPQLSSWDALSADERFIIDRLPTAPGERREDVKKHRYCKRCFFREPLDKKRDA